MYKGLTLLHYDICLTKTEFKYDVFARVKIMFSICVLTFII